jgi:hypothetical protein
VAERYEIRVEGHLDRGWQDWFGGLAIRHEAGGQSVLSGTVEDQVALHGILTRVRDLNLTLVAVTRLGREEDQPDQPEGLSGRVT